MCLFLVFLYWGVTQTNMARTSLKSFLTTARKTLLSPPLPKPVTFVIGNESADLDSLCSAIALAYLRTHTPPHNRLHIPLANLYRPDLILRPELGAVLKRAGITSDDLLTLTELEKVNLKPEDTRWLLVDHNSLTGKLKAPFASRVVGCVDHHDDEGVIPVETGDEPRIIEKCGSCISLVLKCGQDVWLSLQEEKTADDGQGEQDPDVQLAYLAIGPILIDTTNLQSKDKTTALDVEIVELAESVIKSAGLDYDRTAYHDEMTDLKEDLAGMTYRDIFRKDYKKFDDGGLTLGTSAISQGFGYLLEKIGDEDLFIAELEKWAVEQELDIAAVFTILRPNGVFGREMLVWALNEKAVRAVKEFVGKNEKILGLETWDRGRLDDTETSGRWRAAWKQNATEYSRKQTAPMLREAMKR